MAKKVLTPEQQEIKAMKKVKRSQNWTKFWAIVLALALTLGVAYLGKSQGEKNKPEAVQSGTASGDSSNSGSSGSDNDTNYTPDDNAGDNTADDNNGAGDNTADNNGGAAADNNGGAAAADKNDTAAVAAAINKATAAAVSAKAGHTWERHCVVKDIDVGRLTGALNKLIGTISEGASVDSVVGGFLGNGDKKETIKKGTVLTDIKESDGKDYYHGENYKLKATQLKAEDIKNLQVNGDTYTFTLPDCQNPDRKGNVALSRFTNDIVVQSEVDSEIKGHTSAVSISRLQANYKNIKCSVTIKDGKLTELSYSFYADAELDVKLGFTITGTGNLTCNAKYSNFVY